MKRRTGLAQLSPLAVTHCSMPPMTTKPESSTLAGLPLHEGERLSSRVELRAGASAEIESGIHTTTASPKASAINLVTINVPCNGRQAIWHEYSSSRYTCTQDSSARTDRNWR